MDRVLAFGCHPDDVEFMAAGTLALLSEHGYEIHIATMTGGEVGHPALSSQEIRAKRLEEAKASAEILGGHYHYAGGRDLEVEYSTVYRKLATRVIREVDPLIVFTHAPSDYLIDHEETSRLVRNAAFIAPIPLYDCDVSTKLTDCIPYLYYWNAFGLVDIFGRPIPVQFGIDISSVIDTKEKMLLCHESQREWLAHHSKWDAYTNNMREFSKKDGERIGAEYGECFIQHLGEGHPKDNILKEILGTLCVELD
ncbi:MAG TPA: PIG-L family deacetylase [Candidatus Hydrogenedentes bacterium]|nr:PIG-L family deacetylase [Candidatus Hydrogenedentota bacterium]